MRSGDEARGAKLCRGVDDEPVMVCKACWTRTFVVVDAESELLYTLRASDCGSQQRGSRGQRPAQWDRRVARIVRKARLAFPGLVADGERAHGVPPLPRGPKTLSRVL